MASNSTPTRSTSSRDDVLQFLDSLDDYSAPPPASLSSKPKLKPTTRPPTAISTSTSAATPTAPATTVPAAPTAPSTTTDAQEAQSVLDFLDEITQRSATPTATVKPPVSDLHKKPSASSIAGLSRSSSRQNVNAAAASAGVPPRRSTDSVRSHRSAQPASPATGVAPPLPSASASAAPTATAEEPATTTATTTAGGWGWNSVWSQASSVVAQASSVVQQARTVAEEQVKTATAQAQQAAAHAQAAGGIHGLGEGLIKALGENEQAKKWSEGLVEYTKGAHLDQLGKDLKSTTLRSLTDLLNAVAPPIAEHEVIQVSLSHDMLGYEGVETLVYRGLAKIMEQIEGGTLIVNKGQEFKMSEEGASEADEERNLNAIEGLEEGWKLAEANLDQLIKASFKPQPPAATTNTSEEGDLTVPVTTCPIYLRIQPVLAPLPYLPRRPSSSHGSSQDQEDQQTSSKALFFLLLLRDPTHRLAHQSLSQSIPASWLDIPFEENEWVEDVMVEVIRRSVETLGQEYINGRMRFSLSQTAVINKAREEAQRKLQSASGNITPAVVPPPKQEQSQSQSQEEREESSEAAALARATM